MVRIWSPEAKIVLERELWIAVLTAQAELGVEVPRVSSSDYVACARRVDLVSIARRKITRHDVKARIEEFNALAGHEHVHKGMTSRDLTENVEQLQIGERSNWCARGSSPCSHGCPNVRSNMPMCRSPVVATTWRPRSPRLGKRFAIGCRGTPPGTSPIDELIARYPLRGLKGPMGTQQDLLDLLGSAEAVAELERRVAAHLGFARRSRVSGRCTRGRSISTSCPHCFRQRRRRRACRTRFD